MLTQKDVEQLLNQVQLNIAPIRPYRSEAVDILRALLRAWALADELANSPTDTDIDARRTGHQLRRALSGEEETYVKTIHP